MIYGRTYKLHKLRTLHLFAGTGGGILGDLLLGHQPVCAVEIEPYCQQVLHARQQDGILPWFPIFTDVKEFDGKPWRGLVDVVCGGFPCQDIAPGSATKTGIEGARSGLWSHMARTIFDVGPRFVLVENSSIITARGLGRVLIDLAEMGYDARWGVFSAGDVGARHERERMFIAADRDGFVEPPRAWTKQQHGQSPDVGEIHETVPCDCIDAWLAMAGECARMDAGAANYVDRVTAIGNGQVPAVVKLAWNTLLGTVT